MSLVNPDVPVGYPSACWIPESLVDPSVPGGNPGVPGEPQCPRWITVPLLGSVSFVHQTVPGGAQCLWLTLVLLVYSSVF